MSNFETQYVLKYKQKEANNQKWGRSKRFRAIVLASNRYVNGSPDVKDGAPKRTRTSDLRIRNPLLYPAELWVPKCCLKMLGQAKAFFEVRQRVGVNYPQSKCEEA